MIMRYAEMNALHVYYCAFSVTMAREKRLDEKEIEHRLLYSSEEEDLDSSDSEDDEEDDGLPGLLTHR